MDRTRRPWPPATAKDPLHVTDFIAPFRAFARDLRPRKLLLVHGEPDALQWFRPALAADLPATEIIVPAPGVGIDL